MRPKYRTTLIFIALLAATLLLASSLPAFAAPPPEDYRPAEVGPEIREMEPTADNLASLPDNLEEMEAAATATASADLSCVLDTKFFLYLDNFNGFYDFAEFNLLAQSDNSQIWVQADLSWPEGDPRPTPVVTCEQAQYMTEEFDSNIYPTEVDFFGEPDFHDGSNALLPGLVGLPSDYYADPQGRQVVLVSNVRDENYYDPDFPLYIAGFFSTALEGYFDRNTMTIDAYDWANRTGPDSARPFLYEGVFAHEYQHLLHSDYDGNEENWINEGMSDWAERLVGYGIPDSHVDAVAAAPENSLVLWGDQGDLEILTDYGLGYFFQEYVAQKYGPEFNQSLFLNTSNGISGVNEVLAEFGSDETFADLYHGLAADLYTSGAFELEALSDFQIDVGHPGKPNPEAYASPGAPPWGSDYHLLWGYEQIGNLQFNGVQFNSTPWTSDGDILHGGSGDLVDNFLIAEIDLAGVTGATLTFDTKFDIEYSWDYGFVQVSTDGGMTWERLSNDDTCSDLADGAHPKVAANVPGFTGVSGFGCNDPYAEDSYPEAEWISTSFDLSAYDGQQILVAFRYVTDWAFNEPGWYVDNVDVAGVFTSDGSSTEPFRSLNEVLDRENEYTVQLIGERNRRGEAEFEVQTILTGDYVSDWASVREMFDKYRSLVMVVTYDAPEGESAYGDYTFSIDHRGGKHIR